MPQFDFYSFSTQIFWVLFFFVFFYFFILRLYLVVFSQADKINNKLDLFLKS